MMYTLVNIYINSFSLNEFHFIKNICDIYLRYNFIDLRWSLCKRSLSSCCIVSYVNIKERIELYICYFNRPEYLFGKLLIDFGVK